jgi:calcineurin-like phosphoesterase family protein
MYTYELRIMPDKRGRFPNVWITSDTHYNHLNICRGTTAWRNKDGNIPLKAVRDFNTVEAMNDNIVNGINAVVGQDDILILCGDVAFRGVDSVIKFLDRLVCKNLYLVFGNHDEKILDNEEEVRSRFIECYGSYLNLKMGHHRFIISHYPIASWHGLNKGWMHLFGHVHLPTHLRFAPGRAMDIGYDGHPEHRPYHLLDECVPLLEKRPTKSLMWNDHHSDDFREK